MSQDHDTELDHWDAFADAQERATETLAYARSRYQELTKLTVVPDEVYATALGDAEEDVEKLDDVLDVSPDDAARAKAVADRTMLLADVLDAMWQFHTELIEAEISLYETWYEGLSGLPGVDTGEVRDTISSLSAFVENENYGQLRSGDHFTVTRLREQLQEHDEASRESVDAATYVSYCLDTASAFEDTFTADLKQLVADDVSISIKTARKSVTETLDAARNAVDNDEVAESTVQLARVGMEGAMMVKYLTSFERHAHTYCQQLASILDNQASDGNTDELVAENAVDELERLVAASVGDIAAVSQEDRVVDLLRENNRSVATALAASDFDEEAFFEALRIAFETDRIDDLIVTLE